jgi:DnaJ-class molecular chaperone
MMSRTHYLTLGVPRNESPEGIRHAFCALVKRYHPDNVGLPGLSIFRDIVRAYRVLGDPQRRREYDEGLSHAECRAAMLAPMIVPSEFTSGALVPEVGLPLRVDLMRASFEAAFARVADHLRGVGSSPEERSEGLDVQMVISPEMAARGGVACLTIPSCAPCPACGGAGSNGQDPCSFCEGDGVSEEEESIYVPIPSMVGDGALVEIPLRGLGAHNFYLRLQMRVGSQG